MALSSGVRWAIGGGLALAALAAVAVAASSSTAAAPTAPQTTWHFAAGERYRITLTSSIPFVFQGSIAFQTTLNVAAPGAFRVVSATASTSQVMYVVDCLQSFAVPASTFLATATGIAGPSSTPPPITITVDDLGATPVSATGPAATPPATTTPTSSTPAATTPPATPSPPPPATGPIPPPPTPVTPPPATPSNAQILASGTASYVPVPGAGVHGPVRLRLTLTAAAASQLLPAGMGPTGRVGFAQLVGSALSPLFGPAVFVWGPGDARPPDWPADDTNATMGYSLETFAESPQAWDLPTVLGALSGGQGMPAGSAGFWYGQGSGVTAATGPAALTWTGMSVLNPGDHVRASIAPTDLYTVANAVGFTGAVTGPSCAGFLGLLAQTGFVQALAGGSPNLLGWCGQNLLPPDWPSTDNLDAYHLEFRYAGALPLDTTTLAFPLSGVWGASGVGA